MSRNTYVSNYATNEAIKRGLSKYYAGKSLMLGGTSWQAKDIVAAFDAEHAHAAEAERLHVQWLEAVQTFRKTVQTNHRIRLNIKAAMRASHGPESAVYATFGFNPRERQKPTVQTALAAVEKRRATRAARGTKGPRQRAKIKAPPPTAG
jgi:hypothetical protein